MWWILIILVILLCLGATVPRIRARLEAREIAKLKEMRKKGGSHEEKMD